MCFCKDRRVHGNKRAVFQSDVSCNDCHGRRGVTSWGTHCAKHLKGGRQTYCLPRKTKSMPYPLRQELHLTLGSNSRSDRVQPEPVDSVRGWKLLTCRTLGGDFFLSLSLSLLEWHVVSGNRKQALVMSDLWLLHRYRSQQMLVSDHFHVQDKFLYPGQDRASTKQTAPLFNFLFVRSGNVTRANSNTFNV